MITVHISCQYSLEILHAIDPKGDVDFLIVSHSPFSKDKITNVIVHDAKTNKIVWDIHSKNEPVHIKSFRYGSIPLGFREYTKAQKLALNRKYEIEISGSGVSGSRVFTYK
ncbi:MAG: hypothetical protein GY754_15645 [bacterium]|nr:hypothetical protein [bacterium]